MEKCQYVCALEMHEAMTSHNVYASKDHYQGLVHLQKPHGYNIDLNIPRVGPQLVGETQDFCSKTFDLQLHVFLSLLQPVCEALEMFVKCLESLRGDATQGICRQTIKRSISI